MSGYREERQLLLLLASQLSVLSFYQGYTLAFTMKIYLEGSYFLSVMLSKRRASGEEASCISKCE